MELVLVERSSKRSSSNIPKMSVSMKGNIYVNRAGMEFMNIKESVQVRFFQTQSDPKKWFIQIHKDGYLTLKPKNLKGAKNELSGMVYAADIAMKITSSFAHDKGTLKFTIQDQIDHRGGEFFPLEVIPETISFDLPSKNKPYTFAKNSNPES